jgi:uncharacterized DUF497 family protein
MDRRVFDARKRMTAPYGHRRRLLVAVSTDRGDKIRIISARVATRRERKDYACPV